MSVPSVARGTVADGTVVDRTALCIQGARVFFAWVLALGIDAAFEQGTLGI